MVRKTITGNAAILFSLFIPALFGIFILGIDGANMLQSKARLNEALEVASLAVSAQDSDNVATRKETARVYVQHYFPNATVSTAQITVTKKTCETDNSECNLDEDQTRYFEYDVTGSVSENYWLSGSSENSYFKVAASSTAKKYQSESIDIIYVADFSGSMQNAIKDQNGKNRPKYKVLKEIIGDVNEKVAEFNESQKNNSNFSPSKVGFVTYNHRAHPTKGKRVNNWQYTRDYWGRSVLDAKETAKISNIFTTAHTPYNGSENYYDISLTKYFGSSESYFESQLKNFSPSGNTASSQGLIQAARMARNGGNAKRLILILSDGKDNDPSLTSELVETYLLCDKIRNGIQDSSITDEYPFPQDTGIDARIAFIGFGYSTSSNPALIKCAGSKNVYDAATGSDLKNIILSLISEEIGHLAN